MAIVKFSLFTSLVYFLHIENAYSQVINLGRASEFAVLAYSTITNTGLSVIENGGDIGVFPGTSITGFPPGRLDTGTQYSGYNNAPASNAQIDANAAYVYGSGLSPTNPYIAYAATELGGQTLLPGVYKYDSSVSITGTLTLANNPGYTGPNNGWVFQIGSTLTTALGSQIVMTGADQSACNVFWLVGSSATLTGSTFVGNVIADISITLETGVDTTGGLYAMNGAVTLDTNTIALNECAVPSASSTTRAYGGGGGVVVTPTPSSLPPSSLPLATSTVVGGGGGYGGGGGVSLTPSSLFPSSLPLATSTVNGGGGGGGGGASPIASSLTTISTLPIISSISTTTAISTSSRRSLTTPISSSSSAIHSTTSSTTKLASASSSSLKTSTPISSSISSPRTTPSTAKLSTTASSVLTSSGSITTAKALSTKSTTAKSTTSLSTSTSTILTSSITHPSTPSSTHHNHTTTSHPSITSTITATNTNTITETKTYFDETCTCMKSHSVVLTVTEVTVYTTICPSPLITVLESIVTVIPIPSLVAAVTTTEECTECAEKATETAFTSTTTEECTECAEKATETAFTTTTTEECTECTAQKAQQTQTQTQIVIVSCKECGEGSGITATATGTSSAVHSSSSGTDNESQPTGFLMNSSASSERGGSVWMAVLVSVVTLAVLI